MFEIVEKGGVMKLKRFVAVDIRQAIAQVREELGPEAVILSNRTTPDGVEIIAATDYQDSIENVAPANSAAAQLSQTTASNAKDQSKERKTPTLIKADPGSPLRGPLGGKPSGEGSQAWKKLVAQVYESEGVSPPPASAAKPAPRKERPIQAAAEITNRIPAPPSSPTPPTIRPAALTTPMSPVASAVGKSTLAAQPDVALQGVWGELNSLRALLERQVSSLAWGDLSRRFPQRAKLLRRLLELGISPAVSRRILAEVPEDGEVEQVWRRVLTVLANRLSVVRDDVVQKGGVFALIGPTGVGKTTTIAKMAARFALAHGAKGIALVTTDNYRIGAHEQLRTYGRILGTPVRVANDAEDLRTTLKSLGDKQLVLIDTAGMSQRDVRISEQFAMLSEGSALIRSYLVMSAASQLSVLDETIQAFSQASLAGCILTKIDESASLGAALSVTLHHDLPIAYTSDGQRVPEDLQRARGVDLVKRAITLMTKCSKPVEDEEVELAFGGMVANDLF